MFLFIFPITLGFTFNLLSAFTAAFSRKWGERRGTLLTVLFRDILGIPVWTIGFCLAALAPSAFLFQPTPGIKITGWLLIAAGALIIVAAWITIRLRSLAPTATDSLACSGMYARVRHPIHSGAFLEFAGIFLIRPSAPLGLACALGILWLLLQTRFEELDLLQRIPEYREYMNRVPRFFPRIG